MTRGLEGALAAPSPMWSSQGEVRAAVESASDSRPSANVSIRRPCLWRRGEEPAAPRRCPASREAHGKPLDLRPVRSRGWGAPTSAGLRSAGGLVSTAGVGAVELADTVSAGSKPSLLRTASDWVAPRGGSWSLNDTAAVSRHRHTARSVGLRSARSFRPADRPGQRPCRRTRDRRGVPVRARRPALRPAPPAPRPEREPGETQAGPGSPADRPRTRMPDLHVRHRMVGVPLQGQRSNGCALADRRAARHSERAQMEQRHREAVRGLDRHRAAAARHEPGEAHRPGGRSANRCAGRSGHVDSAMLAGGVRIAAEHEGLQHRPVLGPGPGKRGRCADQGRQKDRKQHESVSSCAPPVVVFGVRNRR